ncbi:MAG: class I SAM-dependent methyltransferase [Planctomycetes bacterium]|nr:class I SAM-dependent methyltransferase [Planctomycetota bacterium]
MGDHRVTLGGHWSFNLRNDPKRLAFVLARYKLAAKLACKGRTVLELGCSEGIGTPILGEFATHYTGVDFDHDAIEDAKRNWTDPRFSFRVADVLQEHLGRFETVVSLDVIEHIEPEREARYFDAILDHLTADGMAVIGTPNVTSVPYASPQSQIGHVNMFSAERLSERLRERFHHVFPFGLNDEVVHTGYAPMCHYLVQVACGPKEVGGE